MKGTTTVAPRSDICGTKRTDNEPAKRTMSTKQIGFVGGGRITRASSWFELEGAGAPAANIVVSDCSAEPLARLKARFPAINTVQGSGACASQDLVFLAVHPPVMAEVASAIIGASSSAASAGNSRRAIAISAVVFLVEHCSCIHASVIAICAGNNAAAV